MENRKGYDELIVKWTKKVIEHFRQRQDILAFLVSRIASERWLVSEYGYAVRDLVNKTLELGQPEGRCEVFFELGDFFDLLICPERELDNQNFIKDNAIVIEFKTGPVTSSTLVGEIGKVLNKSKNIRNGYAIGFLYICDEFKQKQWSPLKESESFPALKEKVIEEIKEKNNGIIPLEENDRELTFEFSNGDVSGEACFLIYKIQKKYQGK